MNRFAFGCLRSIVVVSDQRCAQNPKQAHTRWFKILDFKFYFLYCPDAIVMVSHQWCTQNPWWAQHMLILDSNLYIFQFLDAIVVVAHRWCTQNLRWGHANSKFKVLDPRSSFNFHILVSRCYCCGISPVVYTKSQVGTCWSAREESAGRVWVRSCPHRDPSVSVFCSQMYIWRAEQLP